MNQDKLALQLKTALKTPKSQEKFALEITGSCNCRCFHCYASTIKGYPNITLANSKIILQTAKQVGYSQVYIVGGEPMIHPQVLSICRYAKQLHLYTILVSNGSKLGDPKIANAVSRHIDQVEISIRSDQPVIHNTIIVGKTVGSGFQPPDGQPGSFGNAVKALANLTDAKRQYNQDLKIIVNHDLYSNKFLSQPRDFTTIVNIVNYLYLRGVQLDGFYLQLVTVSGRAKRNLSKMPFFNLNRSELISALKQLATIQIKYNILDIRLVDDPTQQGIVSSLASIPAKYQEYIITEHIPAVCAFGFKPNVIHDDIIK